MKILIAILSIALTTQFVVAQMTSYPNVKWNESTGKLDYYETLKGTNKITKHIFNPTLMKRGAK